MSGGPIAPPEASNGRSVPLMAFDQLYSFDRDSLIELVPRPESAPREARTSFAKRPVSCLTASGRWPTTWGRPTNTAHNYLAVRYPAIYATAAEAYGRNASLSGVELRPSRLSGVRRIVDVVFSYTHRQTDVTDKYFVRVDVTEEFPFLVTKIAVL